MSPRIREAAAYGAADALAEARQVSQLNGQAPAPRDVFVDQQVERTTYHDFALYEYVFDPFAQRDDREIETQKPNIPPTAETPPPPQYLPADLDDLRDLGEYARLLIADFLDAEVQQALAEGVDFDPEPIIALLVRFRLRCEQELRRHYARSQVQLRQEDMLVFFIEYFLADLLELFEPMTAAKRSEFFTHYFDPAVVAWSRRAAAMEMPWLLGGRAQQDWFSGSYVIGETFGAVPTRTWVQNSVLIGDSTQVDTYVTDANGRQVQCHEWAWDHIRYGESGAFYTPPINRTVFGAEIWFAPFVPSGETRRVSEVLVGAKQILDRRDVQSELEQLDQAVRDAFDELDVLIGSGPERASSSTERYGFPPYPEGSINFGIRVLYRQAWRPRGVQPGELVRTVPLGPGQVEKVSVKIQRRNRLTRELEDVHATETTQETTSQTTTSSELVEQAASAHKWHVDTSAQGSFTMGVVSLTASMSAGYAGETSKASADTKKSLNESMQKAARVSRRENRVKVSTEHEETFEQTRASEISNPNQEIAVTYLYETIQRIYSVHTALESVEPVVFIGEHVPRPSELNVHWIRRYDWILGRVLLDESFRETLELVTSLEPNFLDTLTATALGLDEVRQLASVLDQAKTSLAAINELEGDVANTYEATLSAYQAAVERSRELLREKRLQISRIQRLVDHLADNILHYCRAIWTAEDPERRTMRYASIRTPTRFIERINTQTVEIDPETGRPIYAGTWEPDPASWRQLTKIIHPAGPVGFAGNYAIYRLRRLRETEGISRVIRIAKQAYFQTSPPYHHIEPAARDGAFQVVVSLENEDFYGGDSYLLRVEIGQAGQPRYQLIRRGFDGPGTDITAPAAQASGAQPGILADPLTLRFDGLLLTVRGGLQPGDQILLIARQPQLVDPEIKYRMALEPYRRVQELEQALDDENTQDIVVDTTNLWLSLLPGTGSILEGFKLQHRQLDVEIARTELARRLLRLYDARLGDPDIEKQVLIRGGMAGLSNGIAAAEAARAEEEARAEGAPALAPAGGGG